MKATYTPDSKKKKLASRPRPNAKSKPQKGPARRTVSAGKKPPAAPNAVVGIGIKVAEDTASLPAWKDLDQPKNKKAKSRKQAKGSEAFLATVSTARLALVIVASALILALYVGHVLATQEVLADLEQERKTNLRLQLELNQLEGRFERLTAPDEIYRRALVLGLEEGTDFGPSVAWESENEATD